MAAVHARHRTRAALVAAAVLGLLVAAASPVHAERLPMRRYTTADGLPHDRVSCVVQDSHGFVWFCTAAGLSRFDGSSFTTFTERDGLPSNAVTHFLETGVGDYWVSTTGGLCRFTAATSRCQLHRLGEDLLSNRASVLHQDRSGQLWVGTERDLFRLDATAPAPHFERASFNPGSAMIQGARALVDDAVGGLWMATGAGVWQRLADARVRRHTFGAEPGADHAVTLMIDHDARVWIAHRTGLIVLMPSTSTDEIRLRDVSASGTVVLPRTPGEAIRFVDIFGASRPQVSALYQSPRGPIWIGTRDALTRFEGGRFHRLPAPRGLSIVGAIALAGDREGNVWVGTIAEGVLKIARPSFVTYDESEGLPPSRIVSIVEDGAGAPVVVAGDGLAYRFDGQRFTSVRPNLPANFVENAAENGQIALQAQTGDWWFRTSDALFRFAVRRFDDLAHAAPQARYTTRDGLTYGRDPRMRLFEDSRGDIWIGAGNDGAGSLTRWDHATRTFQRQPLPPRRRSRPTAFAEDRAGNVWVGLALGGLARCQPVGCEAIDLGALPPAAIRGFYLDDSGRLWFAALDSGLGRIDEPAAAHPAIVAYDTAQGLAGSVHSVTGDRLGRVYAGTPSGVDRLDPATGRVKHFTEADGLAQNAQRIAFRDRGGTLWFGMERGLSSLVPEPDEPGEPPPVRISGVRIAGVSRPLSALGEMAVDEFELAPERHQLQIDFASVGFASGDVVRYQYRLSGVDAEWSPPAPERTVTYAKIAPGSYRFLVRAINADGLTSPQPAAVAFRVLAPLWRQWWFLGLSGAAIGLVGFGLHRYRLRQLLQLERVRTRIASDLHDDIGSTLSQIAIVGEVLQARLAVADQEVRESLSLIGNLSRDSVASMSDIVWATDPHKDRLASLTHRMRRLASDLLPARGIAFRFTGSEDDIALGPDLRRQIFMIFKESLNNAVRHSACASIAIDFRIDGASLALRVADDGHGFDPDRPREGHGLASLTERARSLGGTLEIASRPGLRRQSSDPDPRATAGTTITLRVPYRRAR